MKKEKPIQHSKLYHRLNTVRKHIMSRCNNPNNISYKSYGAKGVSYDPKWNTFEGFLDEVDSIEGWDLGKFLNHELQLDKDIKYKGNKYYSKDTCLWVSPLENVQNRPNYMRDYVALSPKYEYYTFINIDKFCRENNITSEGLRAEVGGYQVGTKGWQIRLLDDIIDRPFKQWWDIFPNRMWIKTRDYEVLSFNTYADACRYLSLKYPMDTYQEGDIQQVVKGNRKHFKGHVAIPFHLPSSYLPKDSEMPSNTSYRDIEVLYPDGSSEIVMYKDRATVYSRLGIDARRVGEHLSGKRKASPSMKGIRMRYV